MGCLTIYTDASYNQTTKVAGYGFWIRDKEVRMQGHGAEADIRCNTYAEIRAISYAIYRVMVEQPELLTHKPYCTVVTDSAAAIEYFMNEGMHKVFDQGPRVYVQEIMEAYKIKFRVRKVKGHSRSDGARSYINSKVDELARQARTLKEARL